MKANPHFRKLRGFTLIELMIVVVIIGILASVAYPSYQDSVRRSNRADAKAVLQENAQSLERFYTTNNQYDATVGPDAIINTADDVAVVLPILQSPRTGTARYAISLFAVADATFTLQAIPAGTMVLDACGTYTLTNTGVQGSGGSVADCWNR